MLSLRRDGATSKSIWAGLSKEFCDFLGSSLAIQEDSYPVDDNASALSVRMEHEDFTTVHLVLFFLSQHNTQHNVLYVLHSNHLRVAT